MLNSDFVIKNGRLKVPVEESQAFFAEKVFKVLVCRNFIREKLSGINDSCSNTKKNKCKE